MNGGGSVYIGFNDFGYFHSDDPIYGYFGCNYVNDGGSTGNVSRVTGQAGTIAEGLALDYPYGTPPDEWVSVISANGGTIHFKSQDNNGRAVYHTNGTYRTIHQTFIFGAMIDGLEGTKQEVMARYLEWLLPDQNTRTPTRTPTITGTPTYTPTGTVSPSRTPTRTPTTVPTDTPTYTATPTCTMTNSPTATFTEEPTLTPSPFLTETPSPGPSVTATAAPENGVTLEMPDDFFNAGDNCYLWAWVYNEDGDMLTGYPLFVILDIFGQYWFAPSWKHYLEGVDYYERTFPSGLSKVIVLDEFPWPSGAGEASGIKFHGALTDPGMSDLFGSMSTLTFGWN